MARIQLLSPTVSKNPPGKLTINFSGTTHQNTDVEIHFNNAQTPQSTLKADGNGNFSGSIVVDAPTGMGPFVLIAKIKDDPKSVSTEVVVPPDQVGTGTTPAPVEELGAQTAGAGH